MNTNYGFCYDKAGNFKKVYPPIYGNGKTVKKPVKTVTGNMPANIGFSPSKAKVN